jgi:hypothetical protein
MLYLFTVRVLSKEITIPKIITFFLSIPHPFFCHSVSPFPYPFQPSYLPSVFIQYFSPFLSLPLSHFATSTPHVLNCFSPLVVHSAPSFFSFRPIPVLYLLVPTSKSRHHFSFFCTLSLPRYCGISSVIHLSYSLPVVSGFFDSLPSFLLVCLCPFHSALHSSIFLLLSIFPLLHCHTRSSGSFL